MTKMGRAKEIGKKQFMRLGLELMGVYKWMTHKHHTNIDRFRKFYGVTPRTCGRLWHRLRTSDDPNICLYSDADPKHLLLAIRFLWRYEVEDEVGRPFGIKSPKTVRKWVKYYLHRMAELLPSLIPKWSDAHNGVIFFFTVDGTHCPIEEPKPFSTKWSSHKFGGHAGLNYEIALRIDKPQLLWLYGPTPPGSMPDITVFQHAFKPKLQQFVDETGAHIRGLGDKGYRGEPSFLSTRNELDPPELAEFKNRALARQETFNQKVKMFDCLKVPFRHGVQFHGVAFRSVTVLTLIQLECGSLSLFDPHYIEN